MSFIGQKHIVDSFREKIRNNKLSHAFALTGPAGIGKRTLGHYLSKMLLCENTNDAPCNMCRSCKTFDAGVNPRFTLIRKETQKILIRQIRALIDHICVRPAAGNKVYLIEEADLMTVDAQNCLLKTLEEPPSYGIILMTTSFYDSLLPTVKSRTVQIQLSPYTNQEIKEILVNNNIKFDGQEYLLNFSRGNPGKAFQLLNVGNFAESRERVMSFILNNNEYSRLDFNQYLSNRKYLFSECMDILESVYRDAILVICGLTDNLINCDKKDKIIEYAKLCDISKLIDNINKVQDIRRNLKRNMNYQLAVDMVTLNV